MSAGDWPPTPSPTPSPAPSRQEPDRLDRTARRFTVTSQAHRVLRSYAAAGRKLTDHDAYRLAGFSRERTSHQRCHDLRHHGLIAWTGERALSPSRHSARTAQITELGMRYLLKLEPFH